MPSIGTNLVLKKMTEAHKARDKQPPPTAAPRAVQAMKPKELREELEVARCQIEEMLAQRRELALELGLTLSTFNWDGISHPLMVDAARNLAEAAVRAERQKTEVNVGDAVRLRHDSEYGKTKMTVIGDDPMRSKVVVGWLDGNSHMQTATVSKAALVKLG